eukprot:5055813-Pyramimonas_sp.AAC.2
MRRVRAARLPRSGHPERPTGAQRGHMGPRRAGGDGGTNSHVDLATPMALKAAIYPPRGPIQRPMVSDKLFGGAMGVPPTHPLCHGVGF